MSLAFTGLGIAAGWRIWRPAPGPAAATAPLVNAPAISPQARKNLGIVIGELKSTPWTKIARFPATLEDSPDATLSLRAPAAGTVVDVRKRAGAMIGAAEAVVTLRADASGETISVAAPAGPPDWDVVESPMNPGVHVDAGATVAVLRDSTDGHRAL